MELFYNTVAVVGFALLVYVFITEKLYDPNNWFEEVEE